MQPAQRLARHPALRHSVRCLTTTANANPVHVTSYTSSSSSVVPLSNVEAQWERLTSEEQLTVHNQLEELQKKDWRELSIDEKKAGSCFSFTPVPFGIPFALPLTTIFPTQLTTWRLGLMAPAPRQVRLAPP
jgi:cytochrome c oxidase subunit 4